MAILILVLILLIDQLTKFLFRDFVIKNTGISFGLLKGNNLLFIFIIILVLFLLVYVYFKLNKISKYLKYGLIFLISGTLSNLMDRILFGYVRDFINIRVWPVFNLADVAIFIGFVLIVINMFKRKAFK